MSEESLEKIASLQDEQQILDEIGGMIAKERESLRSHGQAFSPASTGRKFPLALNLGAVVLLAVVGFGLWSWYSAAQESYVLKAAETNTRGSDIISALLAEAQDSLAAKNKEIAAIQSELADIEAQLSKLGLNDLVKRQKLTDRRAVLQGNLAKALKERDALTRQVTYQSQNLQQAKAAEAGAPAVAADDLANQAQLKKIYDENLRGELRSLGSSISEKKWDAALGDLSRAKELVSNYLSKASGDDRPGAQAQLELLGGLEPLVTGAQTGWASVPTVAVAPAPTPVPVALPPSGDPEAVKKLQEIIRQQTAQLSVQSEQIKAQTAKTVALEALNKESAVQLESVLKSFNTTLGGTTSAQTSVSADNILPKIQELQHIAAKVQDFQIQVQNQASEIKALKASGQSGSSQLGTVLTSFDQFYNTFSPGSKGSTTVDTLPQRMQELQKIILKGQDSQGILQQQAVQLTALNTKVQGLEADRERMVADLGGYTQLGKEYQARVAEASKATLSSDREVLRKNIQTLVNVFKDNKVGAALFPDYSVYMATMIENLVNVETARVKALAQDELLAFMATTSDKLNDEKARLLVATTDNTKKDATALLTSLISEIDQVNNSTLKDRNGKVLPKALGTVINVANPNVTVRKAARFDTTKVKRVYLSRILATGDRIPIAEAEFVATSGDDVVLRIVSTIAPTIYPERNDLVFVEM